MNTSGTWIQNRAGRVKFQQIESNAGRQGKIWRGRGKSGQGELNFREGTVNRGKETQMSERSQLRAGKVKPRKGESNSCWENKIRADCQIRAERTKSRQGD